MTGRPAYRLRVSLHAVGTGMCGRWKVTNVEEVTAMGD